MGLDDIHDPHVVPRWLPVGIHGVPRSREWDVVLQARLPELADTTLEELTVKRLADGSIRADAEQSLPPAAVDRLVAMLADAVDGPYEAVAVRRGVDDWSVAARQLRLDTVELPELAGIDEISVAVSPDGDRVVLLDGTEVEPESAVARAADILEQRGLARYGSFVARAERSGTSWELTLDPL